ncbi:MAG: hypothetical protein HUK17_06910 [Bacteroidales bacterium]|nr:hypothetical protein [Bacteroidales bacterium]
MESNDYIGWVNQRAMRGLDFFTKEDFRSAFPTVSSNTLAVALNRLAEGGWIMSPWQNFYVEVPVQYRLKGCVPPSFYIDELMRFLGRRYYVSLLTAAALYGAGHQRPMSFFVTADGSPLRNGVKNGTQLLLFQKKTIDMRWVRQVRTEGGYMNVSDPMMTVLDIVQNENKIGGLSRVAEMIGELMGEMAWEDRVEELLLMYSPAVVQRLGYLLFVLGMGDVEERLYCICHQMGMRFRYVRLKASKEVVGIPTKDERWKVIVNDQIELDEI